MLELAVIAPVLNERDNVEPLVNTLLGTLEHLEWELIFVDDQSTDGTIEVIDALARAHPNVRAIKRYGRRGLASAVVEGIMASAAPVVAVVDSDGQHDVRILPDMHRKISEGEADLVIGTRYAPGGSTGEWDATRLRGSLGLTRLIRMAGGISVTDPLSGFFAVKREIVAQLRPRLSTIGFKILLDLIVTAGPNLRAAEVPYRFGLRSSGNSKMSSRVALDLLIFFIDKSVGRFFPTRLILFLLVGSIGLVVHLAVLRFALGTLEASFVFAQTAAVVTAIAFNFFLNNAITYADQRLRGWSMARGLLSFYFVCGSGAIANIGVGALVFGQQNVWWVAGIAGAMVGAVWNYAASSLLTWKKG